MVPGTSTTWTCTSEGGYPIQTMTMRKGNTQFSSSQFTTTTQFVTSSQSYTVVGTLRFPPTTADDGQTLYCDVLHAETSSTPQTVSLPLSVRCKYICIIRLVHFPINAISQHILESCTIVCLIHDLQYSMKAVSLCA